LDDLAGAMEELRAAHEEVDAQREELDKACREGQREHQRYVELFENAPDGYVVTDLHGVILQANRAAVELLNSARDSLVGKPLALFVNEEDKTAYFQKLNEMDVIESVRDWELRFQPWKGKPFWTSISIAKVQISEHEDVSLRWLIRDITGRLSLKLAETVLAASERKRLEEALCESEERLRLFVEHAPASLAMFDVEMRYLGFSRRWLSDYNLGDRDLRGLSHYDVFPEIPGYWKEVHRQALAGEVLRAESDRFERADGAVQWLRWEVRPWGNAAGKIGGIVVFSEDITESKRAEDAVRRSEAMLRAVVDQMPSGVTVRDASTGALVLSNVRILEMMGDLVDTLDQLPRYGGSHPDGRPYQTHEWPLSRSLATGEVVDAEEIECERSDGTRITLSVSSAPVRDLQGQITHGVGVFHDITQQKTAKNKLKADTEQLESFNKELEQFFFIATHDLQEPLRKIQTFGNRLGTICKDSIPDEGQAHLKRINNAAKRMSELLSALLAYSRISASPMQIEHTNLTGVAQKAIDKLRTSIDQAGARVELNQLPGLNADPGQIQEIFGLLIGNSLKFRGEQGSPIIKISARMIGDACEISIEDNGIGFDEIYLDKIFTPFQQLHGRGKYEGTGMGLSVCRKIAERHGGRITARGTPGVGATFILTLPLRQNTGTSRSDVTSNGGEDAQRLIHELRVHQIELEMQNEELRNLQVQIEESRSRYADLYDFAPVGYLSCDRGGLILEANLTAATQLGVERSRLIDKPLWLYVLKDDREVIHAHFRNVLDTRERQTCEVRLQAKDGPEFYARLESIFIRDAKGMGRCRTSVIDISGSRIAGEAPH
jgi:PAS domain S-box-containing protein